MTDTPTKSPHYVLVMDKKNNIILGCLIQMIRHNQVIFDLYCLKFGISKEDLVSFIEDISEKEHALGWCDDPNCKQNNKEI